ncbi:unnamed protein product [Coregonus sp. 'balchen']|nr:unnamed protein product [Coregonus sp. 'balchen']
MMAGATFMRFAARTVLSAPACKAVKIRGYHRQYLTTFRNNTSSINGGRTAFLLTLPALSYLGLEAYRRVQSATVVHALEKAEEVVEQADYLYSCGETEKLYQLLLQYKDSDDAEFLWRLARASRDLSLLAHIAADEKKRLTFEAFEYAKKALEKNEACFAAHKWYAVCLSDIGDYEGVKVKIGNSYIIKEHLQLAWYQRKVAAMIFASPPTATYEEDVAVEADHSPSVTPREPSVFSDLLNAELLGPVTTYRDRDMRSTSCMPHSITSSSFSSKYWSHCRGTTSLKPSRKALVCPSTPRENRHSAINLRSLPSGFRSCDVIFPRISMSTEKYISKLHSSMLLSLL